MDTGYPHDLFSSAVSENFECGICLNTCRDAQRCPNEHAFCSSCITIWVSQNAKCPQCR